MPEGYLRDSNENDISAISGNDDPVVTKSYVDQQIQQALGGKIPTGGGSTNTGTDSNAGEAQVIEVEVTGVSANGNVNLAFNDGTTAITKSVLF